MEKEEKFMNSKILKKLVAILMLLSIFLTNISNIVFASIPMNEALIEDKGDCGRHLQYWKEEFLSAAWDQQILLWNR